MKNKIAQLTILAVTMLVMASCGTTKKAATQPDSPTPNQTNQATGGGDPIDAVIAHIGEWQTLQTSGSIKLKAGSSFSSSIQMRMVRDDAIFISLRPVLGIEVGKLLITGDSLFAVDKVHKRYIAEKVSLLTAGIPVTVSDVQNIFLGRPFIIGQGTLNEALKSQVTSTSNGSGVTLSAKEHYKGYGYAFTFNKNNNFIMSLDIVPQGSTSAAYQVKYSDVRITSAGNIAHTINVNASIDKKKLDLALNYRDIDWNRNVKIDRSIPTSYSRMDAKDLFSLFAN